MAGRIGSRDANATEASPMPDETTSLRALAEKTPDADVLRDTIDFAAD